MKKVDMSNVREAGEGRSLPAGKYICTICKVEDVPDKEYLKVTYDIAEGEYKGFYESIRSEHPDWAWVGAYTKSYKPTALPMFKRFCSAVSKSNGNFVFDGGSINSDEKTLVGKRIGLIINSEEYWSNAGEKRTRMYVHSEAPIDKLDSVRIPAPKTITDDCPASGSTSGNDFMTIADSIDNEIPFN